MSRTILKFNVIDVGTISASERREFLLNEISHGDIYYHVNLPNDMLYLWSLCIAQLNIVSKSFYLQSSTKLHPSFLTQGTIPHLEIMINFLHEARYILNDRSKQTHILMLDI